MGGQGFAETQDEHFMVDEWEGPILAWMEESQVGKIWP